jgi:hypothetical protein
VTRATVTIIRRRDYAEVYTEQVQVPSNLQPGLEWIQAHCPLGEPTTVTVADLAHVWNVPESVVMLGLRTLQRSGFFSLEDAGS